MISNRNLDADGNKTDRYYSRYSYRYSEINKRSEIPPARHFKAKQVIL